MGEQSLHRSTNRIPVAARTHDFNLWEIRNKDRPNGEGKYDDETCRSKVHNPWNVYFIDDGGGGGGGVGGDSDYVKIIIV